MMKAEEAEVYSKQGLPNLQNTCYLNSIIQFLFSSRQFKNLIFQNNRSQQCFPLTCALRQIFREIYSFIVDNQKRKKKALKKMIRLFHEKHPNVYCHFQQDFFQILLLLLNHLFEEDPRFQEMFQIQLQSRCGCGKSKAQSYFIHNTKLTCSGCNKQIQTRILSESKLMLVQNSLLEGQKIGVLQLNDRIFYRCIGKVFYSGNSLSGHYTVSRVYNQSSLFMKFNDMSAERDDGNVNPIFMLYQKVSYQSPCPENVNRKDKLQQKQQKKLSEHKDDNKPEIFDRIKSSILSLFLGPKNSEDTLEYLQQLSCQNCC